MTKQRLLIIYKSGLALLVAAAVITQLSHGLKLDTFSVVNFFSYFTIESNLFGLAMFGISAYRLAGQQPSTPTLELLRGAATLYMLVTGLIYAVLLSGIDVQVPLPWVNTVLHYIFPLAVLADWLIDPPRHNIAPRRALQWLAFPLTYGLYTLVRGPLAHDWYPYPFINVAQHGYAQVALNALFIALFFALLALVVARLPRWLKLSAK